MSVYKNIRYENKVTKIHTERRVLAQHPLLVGSDESPSTSKYYQLFRRTSVRNMYPGCYNTMVQVNTSSILHPTIEPSAMPYYFQIYCQIYPVATHLLSRKLFKTLENVYNKQRRQCTPICRSNSLKRTRFLRPYYTNVILCLILNELKTSAHLAQLQNKMPGPVHKNRQNVIADTILQSYGKNCAADDHFMPPIHNCHTYFSRLRYFSDCIVNERLP